MRAAAPSPRHPGPEHRRSEHSVRAGLVGRLAVVRLVVGIASIPGTDPHDPRLGRALFGVRREDKRDVRRRVDPAEVARADRPQPDCEQLAWHGGAVGGTDDPDVDTARPSARQVDRPDVVLEAPIRPAQDEAGSEIAVERDSTAMRSPVQSVGVWAGTSSPICSPTMAITTRRLISVKAAAIAGTASATPTTPSSAIRSCVRAPACSSPPHLASHGSANATES